MTKNEENKFGMYKSVCQTLKDNLTLMSGVPAFCQSISEFEKSITDIEGFDKKVHDDCKRRGDR